jgi:hypothetical protein
MIYIDTSVALAQLLAEDRHPPDSFWNNTLVASRLIEYELWTRIHARGLSATHREATQDLLGRIALLEMIGEVLSRVREPFPVPVRTLDAPSRIHAVPCRARTESRARLLRRAYVDGGATDELRDSFARLTHHQLESFLDSESRPSNKVTKAPSRSARAWTGWRENASCP